MVKSHQQIPGVYSNLGSQQKNSTQGKFMSKSPNPQNKLMTNTNYGKFKGTNGLPVNSVYSRNQGIGGQYLPKLAGGALSQAQLQGVNTQHHLQQQLIQQSSNSQQQNSYQRPKDRKSVV